MGSENRFRDLNSVLAGQVSEINELNEALRLLEKRFNNLVENIGDVIFEVDKDGVIRFISSSIETMTG